MAATANDSSNAHVFKKKIDSNLTQHFKLYIVEDHFMIQSLEINFTITSSK